MPHTDTPRLIVAITGGIASGKSVVGSRFKRMGVTIADADAIARTLVERGQPALAEIVERFGGEMLLADGQLDRNGLRRVVFDDPKARSDLESILHPRIRAALHDACTTATGAYAMADIPLLTEGGGKSAYPWLTRILVVDVPRDLQIQRLQQRDGSTLAQAERILAAQATREQRLAMADDVIDNSGTMAELAAQVEALHARYLELAAAF